MARFLFVGGDAGGDVPPRLSAMAALARRDHRVDHLGVPWLPHQAVDTAAVADLARRVTEAGAHPVGDGGFEMRDGDDHPVPPVEELLTFHNVFVMSFYVPTAAAIARALARQLASVHYDAVVLDMAAMPAAAACEAAGAPCTVLVNTIPFLRWWPERPCPGTGRRLAADPVEDERLATEMLRLADATWLGCVNAIRGSFGLDDLDTIVELEDRAASVIVQTSAAFDHGAATAPANYRYVGPCIPIPPVDATTKDLLASLDRDRPLVLMSPTTTSMATGQVPFVRASIEALEELPVTGLVTVGRSLDPGHFSSETVTVVGHASHPALLPHAAAMITHCGHGTTMTALANGVPLVGVPDFADQPDIAARVVDRGVGIRLDKPVDAPSIRSAVEALLDDRAYRAAAVDLAASLAAEHGPDACAGELEKVAGDGPR